MKVTGDSTGQCDVHPSIRAKDQFVMSYFPSSCLSLPLAVLTKEEPGGKARNLACITKCKELDN